MRGLTPARVTFFMFVAVGGLIAAYVAKGLLATEQQRPQVQTRAIPMAIAQLEPGTLVTESHIGTGQINIADLEPEMLLDNRVIIGRIVKRMVPAAAPFRSSQLYLPGEFPALNVSPGMRAVSVAVNEGVNMVNGLIKPGQYVDVHMTLTDFNGNDNRYEGGLTLTLFKGVRILAMNSNYQSTNVNRTGNSVTLELAPEQANIMILARDRGDITLSFNPEGRGTGGVGVSSEDRATLKEILGLRSDKPFQIEEFRGPTRSTLQFKDGKRIESTGGIGIPIRQQTNSRQTGDNVRPNSTTTGRVSPTA